MLYCWNSGITYHEERKEGFNVTVSRSEIRETEERERNKKRASQPHYFLFCFVREERYTYRLDRILGEGGGGKEVPGLD